MPNRLMQLLADNRQAAARRFEVRAEGDDDDEVEVFLYDAIVDDDLEAEYWGGVSPQAFVKALREVTASTIRLRINSPGGSVFAARAIEQALREHSARVVVHIDGLAASAATFLAMAGDEVVIGKGAMFMIHKAWTYAWGNSRDLSEAAALLEKIDGTLVATYAERTGQTPEQIGDWMSAETWFTAQEAVEHGFADRVAETESKAQAAWNLSAYAKAPRSIQTSGLGRPRPSRISEPTPASAAPLASTEHRERQRQRLAVLQLTDPA